MTNKPSYSFSEDYRDLKYPVDTKYKTAKAKFNSLVCQSLLGNGDPDDPPNNETVQRYWAGIDDVALDFVHDFWYALFLGIRAFKASDCEVPDIKDESIAQKVWTLYKNGVKYGAELGNLIGRNGSKERDKDAVIKAICNILEVDYYYGYLSVKKEIEAAFLDEYEETIDNAIDVHSTPVKNEQWGPLADHFEPVPAGIKLEAILN